MVIYKEPIWNPLELLTRFLDDGGSGTRAGVFFISFAFALAQLGTNIGKFSFPIYDTISHIITNSSQLRILSAQVLT
jgi:cytosine/uracil/thiamine/allantoin permease